MPVAGFSVVPDQNDHENTLNVNYVEGEHTAEVSIGDGYQEFCAHLTVDEMLHVRWLLLDAIEKIQWTEAVWVYARSVGEIKHLMHKGEHGEHAKTVCGTSAPDLLSWFLEPQRGEISTWHLCKRCQKVYERAEKQANDAALTEMAQ